MNRKAQITIFIIIGIVLLLSSALIIYVRNRVAEDKGPTGIEPVIEEVPLELRPISNYITECLRRTAIDGLTILGKQGGHIDMSGKYIIEQKPTESVGIYMGYKIPYWHYLKSSNTCNGNECFFSSEMPYLYRTEDDTGSVEAQLDRYIDSNLDLCLDFSTFEDQGFTIVPVTGIKTRTSVADTDVSFLVDYTIEILKEGRSTDIKQYYTKIPLNFKRIFTFAKNLTDSEKQHSFLEKQTQDVISGYAVGLNSILPPLSASDMSASAPKIWLKSQTKENVKELLMIHTDMLKVANTKNFEPYQLDGIAQSIHNQMILPLDDDKYLDIAAEFTYIPFWDIYFNIDCRGEICQPDRITSPLEIIGVQLQRYEFTYDISHPVLVELSDESERAKTLFGRNGYKFLFALESNIRNFEPMKPNTTYLRVETSEENLLCNINQRQSGNVTVKVINAKTNRNVKNAAVSFTAAGIVCPIGMTSDTGVMVDKFPTGTAGGRLVASADGYFKAEIPFNAKVGENSRQEIRLYEFSPVNITLKIKRIRKKGGSWQLDTVAEDMYSEETAFVTIEKVQEQGDSELARFVNFNNVTKSQTVELVPGEYRIGATVTLNKDIVIPDEYIKVRKNMFKKETVLVPGFTIPMISASTNLNEETKVWQLSQATIDRGKVTMYAVSFHPESFTTHPDTDQINKAEGYVKQHAEELLP